MSRPSGSSGWSRASSAPLTSTSRCRGRSPRSRRGRLPDTDLDGYLLFTTDDSAGSGWTVVVADIDEIDNGFAFAGSDAERKAEKHHLDISSNGNTITVWRPDGSPFSQTARKLDDFLEHACPALEASVHRSPAPAGSTLARFGNGRPERRPRRPPRRLSNKSVQAVWMRARARRAGFRRRRAPRRPLAPALGRRRLRVAAAEVPDHLGLGDALAAGFLGDGGPGSCASGSSSHRASSIASSAPRSAGPR